MQNVDVYVQIAGSEEYGVARNLQGDLAVSMFEIYPKGFVKACWATKPGQAQPILGQAPEGWLPLEPLTLTGEDDRRLTQCLRALVAL